MNISLCCICKKLTEDSIRKYDKYLKLFTEIIVVTNNNLVKVLPNNKIKIITHNFHDDYSELRNVALSEIKTKWAFFLDDDEEISKELLNALPELILKEDVDGFWVSRKNYISSTRYLKYGLFYPDYQLRLFRVNSEYRFQGKIHEVVNIPLSKTRNIKLDLLHFQSPLKYTKFSDFSNMQTYIHIYARELSKKKLSKFSYYKEGLARSLSMFLNGFFRGKGFLDGWAGLRAHLLFSFSILFSYIEASRKKAI